MKTSQLVLAGSVALAACSGTETEPPTSGAEYRPVHAQTIRLGANDNAEVVKVLPGSDRAIVVASKARKLTLLEVGGGTLQTLATATLFAEDTSESELTHVAFAPDGTWAVLTRTKVVKDMAGATTDCAGSLVFVDAREGADFGAVLSEVDVGPMPDAVDVSPDGKWVVSANERDFVWGKCEGLENLEGPSISVLDVTGGAASAQEVTRVMMAENSEREPEYVVFGQDSDLIVATLQDSHEVLFIRRSAVVAAMSPTEALGTVVRLPQNQIEQDPWPDGLATWIDGAGEQFFVVAGEANDTLCVLDEAGNMMSTLEITEADIPDSFPRDGSWGPLFRPDSVTAYAFEGKSYVAASLKASGAVGVWDATDPTSLRRVTVEKVGEADGAGRDEESMLGTEGISASSTRGFIITANEVESSVSLLLP